MPSRRGIYLPDITVVPEGTLHAAEEGRLPAAAGSARRGAPEKGAYRVLSRVAFGEPIALPAPFDLVIDTAEFPGT
ncbi:hypothetical protein ACWDPF_30855 [Streptomyces albogriseolus]